MTTSFIGAYRFDPRKLITKQGEIDRAYLVHEARTRAIRDWGQANPPPAYVRPHIQNLETQGHFVRAEWRRDHHLPDDTCYVRSFTISAARRVFE
jgi:hypothetical protein